MSHNKETNPHFVIEQHPQGQLPQQPPQYHAQRPQQPPPQQPPQQPPHHQGQHPQQHPQQGQHSQQPPHPSLPQSLGVGTPLPPRRGQHSVQFPRIRRTRPSTWFLAVFCAIFWVLIILGGLIVLIIYLLYRPHSPRFDVSSVTLNAAYLDMGYLLNADVTMLVNFTNPNKKVGIDFNSVVLNLYYEDTLIATRYIAPFSAPDLSSRFANVHMVTSQVRLSVKDILLLKRQIQSNRIMFQVKGYFRTRSTLGRFLRYSYWLYGHCTILVTDPPTGVLVAKKCRTKR